jgi:RNA-directed DNA polymerase
MGSLYQPREEHTTHTIKNGHHGGFDYLGFNITQYRVGKKNKLITKIRPSKKATKKIYDKIRKVIEHPKYKPNPKRNSARKHQEDQGRPTQEEQMIKELNLIINGWTNYYRAYGCSRDFNKLGNKIHNKTFRWAKAHTKGKIRQYTIDKFLGTERSKWTLRSRRNPQIHLTETWTATYKRRIPVRLEKSYYDGDWRYWLTRDNQLPAGPKQLANTIHKQKGRCAICHKRIQPGEKLIQSSKLEQSINKSTAHIMIHATCDQSSALTTLRSPLR